MTQVYLKIFRKSKTTVLKMCQYLSNFYFPLQTMRSNIIPQHDTYLLVTLIVSINYITRVSPSQVMAFFGKYSYVQLTSRLIMQIQYSLYIFFFFSICNIELVTEKFVVTVNNIFFETYESGNFCWMKLVAYIYHTFPISLQCTK